MTSTAFTLTTDSDGIALVTWDMKDRSMNVITQDVMTELNDIIDKVVADAAIKGCVISSGKDNFSGGADLTMLEGFSRQYAQMLRSDGEEKATSDHGRRPY